MKLRRTENGANFLGHPVYLPCITALGQAMLYVDGMNGVISHIGTIQWLYSLCAAKVGITRGYQL